MSNKTAIDKILVMDCETTGMFFGVDDPSTNGSQRHESISWGFIVVSGTDFSVIDNLYIEIQPSHQSQWSMEAQQTHGLTREHLALHGKSREDAACDVAELLLKHFEGKVIVLAGQNVASFDKPFLKQLLRDHGLLEHFKFSHRSIDTFSVGMAMFGFTDSDQLFNAFNCRVPGMVHNALTDAAAVLKVLQTTRQIVQGLQNSRK